MTRLGINLEKHKLSPEQFSKVVEKNQQASMKSRWVMADLYAYSEENPDYADAFEQSYDEHLISRTFVRYANTVRKFPLKDRHYPMGIEMYYTVQSLDNEKAHTLLREAYNEGWSREFLRGAVREAKGLPTVEDDYTTCKLIHIADILAEYGMNMDASVEVKITDKNVRIKVLENVA